jgi:hypothetical protein
MFVERYQLTVGCTFFGRIRQLYFLAIGNFVELFGHWTALVYFLTFLHAFELKISTKNASGSGRFKIRSDLLYNTTLLKGHGG